MQHCRVRRRVPRFERLPAGRRVRDLLQGRPAARSSYWQQTLRHRSARRVPGRVGRVRLPHPQVRAQRHLAGIDSARLS